ncbi:hypothetical protein LTR97_011760 [Elasticomyces elasticus]|uniref:Heterokaryon incompatibility domain-containing protein n=1 Tax=Elasticomyces elasticus TaxID=574655 RepID=A0AAN7VL87_9PEZI|nr:hypothetical protein LTR97_011760 [Elasticomyces elasticus]
MTSRQIATFTTGHARPLYERLPRDSIRLLRLLRHATRDTIREIQCETSSFRRDEAPAYTALSYAWGPEDSTIYRIAVNGHCFYVRENLFLFLRRELDSLLAQSCEWLWIDAISIDQLNPAEKSHQVASMSQVYSNAVSVVVWLGPGDVDSDRAMQILDETWRWDHQTALKFEAIWTQARSTAMLKLLDRPYWSRLWVFQELALTRCKLLICGDKIVAWESLADFVDALEYAQGIYASDGNDPSIDESNKDQETYASTTRAADLEHCRQEALKKPAILMVRHASQRSEGTTLFDLMLALKHLRCAEPKDKVYALLGVAARSDAVIRLDVTTSFTQLLHAVLKDHHRTMMPKAISEVQRQCEELESLADFRQGTMLQIEPDLPGMRQVRPRITIAFDTFALGIGPSNSPINFLWALFHGHGAVEDLLTSINATSNPPNHLEHWLERAVSEGQEALVEMLLALKVIRTDRQLVTNILDTALQSRDDAIALRLLETGHFDDNAELLVVSEIQWLKRQRPRESFLQEKAAQQKYQPQPSIILQLSLPTRGMRVGNSRIPQHLPDTLDRGRRGLNRGLPDRPGNVSARRVLALTALAFQKHEFNNSVAKVVEPVPLLGTLQQVSLDKQIRDGVNLNIRTAAQSVVHFRILALAMKNYEEVHRQCAPSKTSDFPLGKLRDLRATRDQARRIEIVYPDDLVIVRHLSFVEPKQLSIGYPLIHIVNDCLSGNTDHNPSLIPSELAQALHFSHLTEDARGRITSQYFQFITLARGNGGHVGIYNLTKHTTPLVAYLEAINHFSQRYSKFSASQYDHTAGPDKRRAFVEAEIESNHYWLDKGHVGILSRTNVQPSAGSETRGGDNEGAVYGAIFLDYAHRTTLKDAVDAYHLSKALSFGEYKTWIETHRPAHAKFANHIRAVAETWDM